MTTSKLRKIVEEELKNMEIAPQGYSTPSVNKSQLTPGTPLSALKKKFLSLDNEERLNGLEQEVAIETVIVPEEDDIEVIVVQKKSSENDSPANGEKRTIIGSNSKGLLGTQG